MDVVYLTSLSQKEELSLANNIFAESKFCAVRQHHLTVSPILLHSSSFCRMKLTRNLSWSSEIFNDLGSSGIEGLGLQIIISIFLWNNDRPTCALKRFHRRKMAARAVISARKGRGNDPRANSSLSIKAWTGDSLVLISSELLAGSSNLFRARLQKPAARRSQAERENRMTKLKATTRLRDLTLDPWFLSLLFFRSIYM